MITYRDKIGELPDELKFELLRALLFMNNKHINYSMLDEEFNDWNRFILRLFTWDLTPQGHVFWHTIYEKEKYG